MRVYIGSDHAGFELKAALLDHLSAAGQEVVDIGPHVYDPQDDYPPFCLETGRRVVADPGSLGVVIGGSGNGEQIAANKVAGVRAALAFSEETARLARQHNDANVISLGAREYDIPTAILFVDTFLATPFSHDPRHQRRIDLVSAYEANPAPPELPAT
jgi:ribose 5-phosphate isomerase B